MNEIIEIKQLPVIVEQLQTIKAEITERTKTALSLVCTEDTLSAVKKERAALTKEFTAWEEKRKEVKKAIISPYEQFETVYKECVTEVFRTADNELKTKINTVENELKTQKTEQVKTYFDEYLQSKNIDFVNWERANIPVTMSASLKSLKDKSKEFIDRVCDDLALIDTQEHKDEILYEYKQSLNVSSAITTVSARFKAIEEAKIRADEQKAKETAENKAVAKVESVIEPPITAPVEEENILTLKFTVKGTRTQLKALKEFLIKGGYDYE